jgi:hypothetical protein
MICEMELSWLVNFWWQARRGLEDVSK